jgi:hypothetical protein
VSMIHSGLVSKGPKIPRAGYLLAVLYKKLAYPIYYPAACVTAFTSPDVWTHVGECTDLLSVRLLTRSQI